MKRSILTTTALAATLALAALPVSAQPVLDLATASATLGVTEQALNEALGDPSQGAPDVPAAAAALGVTSEALQSALGFEPETPDLDPYTVAINGVDFEINQPVFTWDALPDDVIHTRMPVQDFTGPDGATHRYEVIFVESGNLNWHQAAYLAEDAGGYLASANSAEENAFIFALVNDPKFFWSFDEDGDHYGISIGPFLGGYQPEGSEEPAGGWMWLDGTAFGYTNWAQNLDDGVTDKDPRDNTQPNDSGDGQPIMGFGEMNEPVPTWGDYMEAVGTYGKTRLPGLSYGFVIEYPN